MQTFDSCKDVCPQAFVAAVTSATATAAAAQLCASCGLTESDPIPDAAAATSTAAKCCVASVSNDSAECAHDRRCTMSWWCWSRSTSTPTFARAHRSRPSLVRRWCVTRRAYAVRMYKDAAIAYCLRRAAMSIWIEAAVAWQETDMLSIAWHVDLISHVCTLHCFPDILHIR